MGPARLALCVVLLAACVGVTRAERLGSVLTWRQAAGLAELALAHTPEHTHCAKGTYFSWVLFNDKGRNGDYPEVALAIRAALATRYVVHTSEATLPKGALTVDGVYTTYRGGFRSSVRVRRLSDYEIEVTYSDYESPMGAGGLVATYRWSWGDWRVVWSRLLPVA